MPSPRFEVYIGIDRRWYWRLKAANGQTTAVGGESYASKTSAIRAIGGVVRQIGELYSDAVEALVKEVPA